MLRIPLLLSMIVLALFSRCDTPHPATEKKAAQIGDSVKLRGTLSEDVDCRLLKCDDGEMYSLSARLPNSINGTRVCIYGTLIETTQCLVQPSVEVQSVRAWSSCP
jgi:hypothetical protein